MFTKKTAPEGTVFLLQNMTPADGNRTVNQIYSYDRITQYSIENNTLTITFLHGTPVEDTRVRIYYFEEKVGG